MNRRSFLGLFGKGAAAAALAPFAAKLAHEDEAEAAPAAEDFDLAVGPAYGKDTIIRFTPVEDRWDQWVGTLTLIVDNTTDSRPGSFREALRTA